MSLTPFGTYIGGAAGARGPRGPTGPTGPKGDTGVLYISPNTSPLVLNPVSQTLSIMYADGNTHNGIVSTVAQNFGGTKTFTDGVVTSNLVISELATGGKLIAEADTGKISISSEGDNLTFSGFEAWTDPNIDHFSMGGPLFQVEAGRGYIKGILKTWAQQSITLTFAETTHVLYIDSTGTLRSKEYNTYTTTDYEDNITLFEVFKPAGGPAYIVVRENHSYKMPPIVNEYLHSNLGILIRGTGGVMTTYGAAANKQISISPDVLDDHGLYETFSQLNAPYLYSFYLNASGKWAYHVHTTAIYDGWNDAGVPTDATGNQRTIHLIAMTKSNGNPNASPIICDILQPNVYNTLTQATSAISSGSVQLATNELRAMELAYLGYVILSGGTIESVIVQKSTISTKLIGGYAGDHETLNGLNNGTYGDGGHTNLTVTIRDTRNPTPIDSSYKEGTIWVNTSDNRSFILVDNQAGASFWKRLDITTTTGTNDLMTAIEIITDTINGLGTNLVTFGDPIKVDVINASLANVITMADIELNNISSIGMTGVNVDGVICNNSTIICSEVSSNSLSTDTIKSLSGNVVSFGHPIKVDGISAVGTSGVNIAGVICDANNITLDGISSAGTEINIYKKISGTSADFVSARIDSMTSLTDGAGVDFTGNVKCQQIIQSNTIQPYSGTSLTLQNLTLNSNEAVAPQLSLGNEFRFASGQFTTNSPNFGSNPRSAFSIALSYGLNCLVSVKYYDDPLTAVRNAMWIISGFTDNQQCISVHEIVSYDDAIDLCYKTTAGLATFGFLTPNPSLVMVCKWDLIVFGHDLAAVTNLVGVADADLKSYSDVSRLPPTSIKSTHNTTDTFLQGLEIRARAVAEQDDNLASFYSSANLVGSITTNETTTSYNTTSDYRLKRDIVPISNALVQVLGLNPCTYKWISNDTEGVGFIAHELQQVAPYAVINRKDQIDERGKPVFQCVDYSKLTPLLCKAIQEVNGDVSQVKILANSITELISDLQDQNETQQNEITALQQNECLPKIVARMSDLTAQSAVVSARQMLIYESEDTGDLKIAYKRNNGSKTCYTLS